MVFKLLRTDSDEPCKIQLPVGKHLIGRGKFLDCEDKRVSRNHGELEVLSDTVVIKALHQNPCFVIRKGTEEVQIVKQNCTANLDNGDKFGLLPNTYWYELLHCAFADINKDEGKVLSQNEDANSIATEPMESGNDPMESGTEPIESGNFTRNDESQIMDFELNDSTANNIPGSPSLLPPETEGSSPKRKLANEGPNANDEPNSPSKRSHSSDDESVVKKIKTEPDTEKETEVKTEPCDAAAGTSNDQVASSSSKQNDGRSKSPQQNPLLRERCMYGASCYRKNPQHKAQFSHPSDSDWGTGAQAVCPWGSGCRRTDPRHWRDHSHPPGVQPQPNVQPPRNFQPNPGNKRKPKPKRKNDSDDDDDEDVPSANIIQGKRTRKTIYRPSTWSGSESENEDPYQTDDSDEWQPNSDMTDSQMYSQDFSQI